MQCQKKNCLKIMQASCFLMKGLIDYRMMIMANGLEDGSVSLSTERLSSPLSSPLMAQLLALMHFKHTADTLDGKCTSFPPLSLSLLSLLSYAQHPSNTSNQTGLGFLAALYLQTDSYKYSDIC